MKDKTKELLGKIKTGEISVDEALLKLKTAPYTDIDFAKIDSHRELRQGVAEVIYGECKTAGQIIQIAETMKANGQNNILVTRLSPEKAAEIKEQTAFTYFAEGKIGMTGTFPEADGNGKILILTGGTGDLPVADEAEITAKALGNETTLICDVGVAGIHRLFSHIDEIMTASVIIVIAGMEGALAGVVGGLAHCPVIAVPTSVGYGSAFEGVTALLSMLNSCSAGIGVVNIDNGFGAAFLASKINHTEGRK